MHLIQSGSRVAASDAAICTGFSFAYVLQEHIHNTDDILLLSIQTKRESLCLLAHIGRIWPYLYAEQSMTDTITTWHDWQGAHTMAKPPNWSKTGLLLPLSVYLSVYLFRYQSPGMPNLHDMACFLACGGATGRQL